VEQAPTPYDITNIPASPFEPGLVLWILSLALLGLSILLYRKYSKTKIPASRAKAIKLAEQSISQIETSSTTAEQRLSFLLKRLAEHLTSLPFVSMTANEIATRKEQELLGENQALLSMICELEQRRYSGAAPESFEQTRLKALEVVRRLKEVLPA